MSFDPFLRSDFYAIAAFNKSFERSSVTEFLVDFSVCFLVDLIMCMYIWFISLLY